MSSLLFAVYRVLLVDDDPHILNTNEKYLCQKGCQVFCAGTAEDALGDTDRLRRALENLCYNALSFTPPDGVITLRLPLA